MATLTVINKPAYKSHWQWCAHLSRQSRKSPDLQLLAWDKYYKIIITDRSESFEQRLINSNNDNFVSESNVEQAIIDEYCPGDEILKIGEKPIHLNPTMMIGTEICFVRMSEAKEVTEPSPKELKLWQENEDRKNKSKLVSMCTKDNINALISKYGLVFDVSEYNGQVGLHFTSDKALKDFVMQYFKDTVLKEIKEQLGVTLNINTRTKKIETYNNLIDPCNYKFLDE